MSLNLAFILDEMGGAVPDQTALIIEDSKITHRQLQMASMRMAGWLQAKGIKPGRKVAIMVPNVPQFTIAYFGILRMGAVAVTVNVLSAGDEVAYYLNNSDAEVLIAWHEFSEAATAGFEQAERCREMIMVGGDADDLADQVRAIEPWTDIYPTMPEDTAVIIYTSATTGRAKGVELTHFNLYSNAQFLPLWMLSDYPKVRLLGPGDVAMAALPLFHSFGQSLIQNAALIYGAAVCYLPRWEPEKALETIQRNKVTMFAGVPSMYMSWLALEGAQDYDLSSLLVLMSGGAPLPWAVFDQVKAKFGVTILQGYGLTETSPAACFSQLHRPIVPHSSGRPIWGVQMDVIDDQGRFVERGGEGEIVVRGHNIMKGYYKQPEATAEAIVDGWFRTGDIGKMDGDDNVFIIDRMKEMLLRKGYNVYPAEVERVIYDHPAVHQVAVIGVPVDGLGEEVKAIVVLHPGSQTTDQDVIDHCKKHLAAYKYPRIVEFRDELPKGPTGKVLKKQLTAEVRGVRGG